MELNFGVFVACLVVRDFCFEVLFCFLVGLTFFNFVDSFGLGSLVLAVELNGGNEVKIPEREGSSFERLSALTLLFPVK